MGGILVLAGVLVFIYMTARGLDRYPWPWMSFVLILFITISAIISIFATIPSFAIALLSGVIGYLVMKKIDQKGVFTSH